MGAPHEGVSGGRVGYRRCLRIGCLLAVLGGLGACTSPESRGLSGVAGGPAGGQASGPVSDEEVGWMTETGSSVLGGELRALYREVRGKDSYEAPTVEEGEKLERLARRLWGCVRRGVVEGCELERLQEEARGVGLELRVLGGGQLWALVERADRRRGWGAWVFRLGELRVEAILQTPHTFHDAQTGRFGLTSFERQSWRAWGFNTIHRYAGGRPEGDESEVETDVAHSPGHPFQRITEVALEVIRTPLVVQVHGFRRSSRSGDAELIVSEGHRGRLSPRVRALVEALRGVYPHVKEYPEQVQVLGGETNVQGRVVRAHPGALFVHLELAERLREPMATEVEARVRLSEVLGRVLLLETGG